MTVRSPAELIETIYLGDRGCNAVRLETARHEVVVEVTCISRTRTPGNWDYFTDEDIIDGRLVFTGVESCVLEPAGPMPNDFINGLTAKPVDLAGVRWQFELSISSVDADATSTEVVVRIIARDMHLEDPARPGVRIRD